MTEEKKEDIADSNNYVNSTTYDKTIKDNQDIKLEKKTGHENLIPINERAEDEQRAMRLKAGIKSGEVRREQASARKIYEMLLKQKPTETIVSKIHEQLPDIPVEQITLKVAAQFSITQQALKGNTKAWDSIQASIGEAPLKTQLNMSLREVLDNATEDEIKTMLNELKEFKAKIQNTGESNG